MKKAIVAFKPSNVKATKIIIHIPFIFNSFFQIHPKWNINCKQCCQNTMKEKVALHHLISKPACLKKGKVALAFIAFPLVPFLFLSGNLLFKKASKILLNIS